MPPLAYGDAIADFKPNVVLIGAAKAGTTSLYSYLSEHPQVFLPQALKEINFLGGVNQAISTEEQYLALYRESGSFPVRMDISTAYLYAPGTAEKIRTFLGDDVKILAFLRNPVDASYSMWKQIRHFGDETLSFEEALEVEARRRDDPDMRSSLKGWAPNYFYKERNLYAPQLQRYFDVFPAAHIKVFVFEDFFGDLATGWRDLCAFLEIDSSFMPKSLGTVLNPASSGHRSKFLHSVIYEKLWWKRLFTWAVPEKLKSKLRFYLDDLNKKYDPNDTMAPATRQRLASEFASDVKDLEGLLGRSLTDVWLQS